MKKLIFILFSLLFFSAYSQDENLDASTIKLRRFIYNTNSGGLDTFVTVDGALFKVTNLKDPVNPLDAVNLKYLEENSISQSTPLDSLLFSTDISNLTIQEGKLWYDSLSQSLKVTTESPYVVMELGQEMWTPLVYNNTGSNITDGTPVYLDTIQGNYFTINIASNEKYRESRLLGVATEPIEAGMTGRVTVYGEVEMNYPSLTNGIVYLGEDGTLTSTKPSGGRWVTIVGLYNDNINKLFVNPVTTPYTDELIKAYGFTNYNNTDNTLSFSNSTRTFSISPTGDDFYFYQEGVKYISTGDNIVISNTEGTHLIYYDEGELLEIVNPTESEIEDIIKNKVTVSWLYWDATNSQEIYFANERHTYHLDTWVHYYLHKALGTQYISGLGVSTVNTLGDGSLDSHAQFAINNGTISDEDIETDVPFFSQTSTIYYYYKSGTLWKRSSNPTFSFPVGATPLPQYNTISGGSGLLSEVTSGSFVLNYVFALNSNADAYKLFAVTGQSQYGTLSEAQTAAKSGKGLIQMPPFLQEAKLLYVFIIEGKTSFTNSVNARLRKAISPVTGLEVDYVDFRLSNSSPSGGSSGSETTTFLSNTDTPSSYAGEGGKLVRVNAGEDALEFYSHLNYLLTDFDSTGFRITESQISDLDHFTNSDETDPVVGAINGIVKADGAGNISQAVSDTDYDSSITNEIQTIDVFNLSETTLSLSLLNDGQATKTVDLNSLTANKTITLSGDVAGSGTTSITTAVSDDSHNHIILNVDGLGDTLNQHRTDIDQNITDIISLNDSIQTHRTDIDLNTTNIATNQQAIIDTASQIRTDIPTTLTDLDSTGFQITESQISDLNNYVDSVYSESDGQFPIDYLRYLTSGDTVLVGDIPKSNGLISGGAVVWQDGLNFAVTPAAYYINGDLHTTSEATVTLSTADGSNDRIDVIVVDTTGSVIVVEGTAATSPSKPFVNPQSQLELTQVLVQTGDTIPSQIGGDSITGVTVYNENTEWTGSATGVTVDFASTTFAKSGSVSANVGTIGNYDLVRFTDASNHLISDYETVSFYIKLKEAMPTQHALRVDLVDDGVITGLGNTVKLNKSSTDWQLVSVPFTDFDVNGTTFDQIRFWYVSQDADSTISGFYIDKVVLQEGLEQPVSSDLSNYWSKEEITEADTTRWGETKTHTGEVTGSDILTVADGVIDYANIDSTLTDSITNNTLAWDISSSGIIYCTPSTGTVSFSNPQVNKSITVVLTLSGGATLTWPSTAKILDGSATLGDGTFYVYIHCISDTIYTVSITKEAS